MFHPKLANHMLWGPTIPMFFLWLFYLVSTGSGFWGRQDFTHIGLGAYYQCSDETSCTYLETNDILAQCDSDKGGARDSTDFCSRYLVIRAFIAFCAAFSTVMIFLQLLQILRHYIQHFNHILSMEFYYRISFLCEYICYFIAFWGFLNIPISGSFFSQRFIENQPEWHLTTGFIFNFIATGLAVFVGILLRKFVNPVLKEDCENLPQITITPPARK